MGPRLSKNILEIQQIESGTLAKFWSDGRNVAKVIANLVQPFCQKQALQVLQVALGGSDWSGTQTGDTVLLCSSLQ